MFFGALPILKCLPIRYDPKGRFMHKLRHHLPYGIRDNDISITTFLDNGLCILTNKQPTKWGSESYTVTACDDSLANKGWLWCYYQPQKLMIVNTHMQVYICTCLHNRNRFDIHNNPCPLQVAHVVFFSASLCMDNQMNHLYKTHITVAYRQRVPDTSDCYKSRN